MSGPTLQNLSVSKEKKKNPRTKKKPTLLKITFFLFPKMRQKPISQGNVKQI